jgi:hypothetical protein
VSGAPFPMANGEWRMAEGETPVTGHYNLSQKS